ncbi:hypothetical protein HDV05_004456 [Chytridiales sp. JEL 0842]|nr:hypothetical protein HDV05_004456 [Chytridiales sp. JEL 0842]
MPATRKCSRCKKQHSDFNVKKGGLYSECNSCRERTARRRVTQGSGICNEETNPIKLRDVREKRACYSPICRKSLGDKPYVDGTGKYFCTESCSNKQWNGTASYYESLRRHYARRRARPDSTETLAEWLISNSKDLPEMLGDSKNILDAENLVIWDTESDGVGGTHTLELTREWGFLKLSTHETLHVYRGDSSAKTKILEFVNGASHLIAFEPKGCDRNRLQELLSPTEFKLIRSKLVDFRRDIFDKFSTTNHLDKSRYYTQDGMQQTIWMNSGIEDGDEGMVELPEETRENKCGVDIAKLSNLVLLLKACCNLL